MFPKFIVTHIPTKALSLKLTTPYIVSRRSAGGFAFGRCHVSRSTSHDFYGEGSVGLFVGVASHVGGAEGAFLLEVAIVVIDVVVAELGGGEEGEGGC